jgi:hypothetical protein
MATPRTRNKLPPDRRASGTPDSPDDQFRALQGGVDVSEYVALEDDPDVIDMVPTEDGGAIYYLGGDTEDPERTSGEFYDNLAEDIPDPVLTRIASDLLRKIEEDKKDREPRDKQYEEGIRRTGLGKDAPGGADFEGASRVVHPMITEAAIDYASRIMKELFPIAGPVKPKINGVVTAEKQERADRVTGHMNWQLTEQIAEARTVMEKTLTQVPLGGSQFIRQWWDHRLGRPRWAFVPIDNVYIPANAGDFATATRKTFAESITQVEYRHRVDSGQYRDIMTPPPSQLPEPSRAKRASDKVEGVGDPALNLDGDRMVYEVSTYLEVTPEMADILGLEEEDKLYPYIVTIDESSRQVLALYRDWEEDDETHEPIDYLFEIPFLPWRGAYAVGLPHVIGGLSAATTGALRALLDTAHAQNAISGAVLKGSGVSGQTNQPEIGQMIEIDGGLEADDIRKRVMKFDMGTPSPVLLQLLGILVESARGVVRTSLDDQATNTNANTPVGTQLSRVEEGLVVYSAVHGRAHAALNRILRGLARLNRLYLPESIRVDIAGKEIFVRRSDYDGPPAIQPVSDPTIYSDQQRLAQINAVQMRVKEAPGLYNLRKVEERFLALLKLPDFEELLTDKPEPHELNAVNENLSMALGQPVVVFPEQNHLAHLQVLLDFMKSPVLGANPLIAPKYLPLALQHAAEHIVYFYVQHTTDLVKEAAGVPASELMSNDDKVKGMFDELMAMASQHVVPGVEQAFVQAAPVLQAAMQMAIALRPKPPVDPAIEAATQTALAETKRKGEKDKADAALEQQQQQIEQAKLEEKRESDARDAAVKVETNTDDNITALAIASKAGEHLINGGSITDRSN